jgi:hypothetical protein
MSDERRSSTRDDGLRHRNPADESTRSTRRDLSSAWSALGEDTVPFLDDLERVEAEEHEARRRVVMGQRRRGWR